MPTLRPFYPLLLAFALLFAQQGATLHTLRHVFAEHTQQQNKQLPHTGDCEQCTTYAQLASALNNGYLTFDFCTSLIHVYAQSAVTHLSQHSITASARGPPTLQS